MGERPQLVGRKIAASVLWDTVTIEIICGDDYEGCGSFR